ncbi:hypothetical protein K6U21_04715, partial [Vibrio vulnificus]|nr:hypothetical protein [Vibrio vulnificus]
QNWLPAQCQRCAFLPMSQGGCPKNPFLTTPQVGTPATPRKRTRHETSPQHSLPHMLRMVGAMQKGHSPAFYQLF